MTDPSTAPSSRWSRGACRWRILRGDHSRGRQVVRLPGRLPRGWVIRGGLFQGVEKLQIVDVLRAGRSWCEESLVGGGQAGHLVRGQVAGREAIGRIVEPGAAQAPVPQSTLPQRRWLTRSNRSTTTPETGRTQPPRPAPVAMPTSSCPLRVAPTPQLPRCPPRTTKPIATWG
jgi:hypothetical protein